MRRSVRRLRSIAVSAAILVLVVAVAVWVGTVAIERWLGQELRALATARLNPAFAFDDLTYTLPSTITLRGVRLTSPDPGAPSKAIEILAIDSLSLVLSNIPWPDGPFRVQRLALAAPTLRLVRIRAGEASGDLLGFSDLLKEEPEPAGSSARSPARLSDLLQVRVVSIEGGRAQFDFRDGSAAVMLIDGIVAKLAFDATAKSQLQAELELSNASYAAGNFGLKLDHIGARISSARKTVTIEKLAIDALGGHARIGGTFELDDLLTGALSFEGADLQIGDLLRGADDPKDVPSFSGLLGFSGTLRGPLAELDERAEGQGRLSLRKARLGRLPVLSTIDEALDPLAEAAMKREHTGHDALSLQFSLDGDRARIEKLRLNSRWYGLRGHGYVYFDSRLDLAVDGGPLQRLENEFGAAGEVLGELIETLLRARVSGTLGEPKVDIEVLRHSLRR